ncbi:MAG: hypothetical protein ABIO04_05510 [Ferruginibacter sp.]
MITAYLHSRPKSKMSSTEKNFLSQTISVHELIDNVFQRFLISYSMMYNKLHIRKGNLFHRPFKHVQIKDEAQFSQTVIYINANAVKHKLVTDLTTYKWSSYSSLLSTKETKLYRNEILDWFGGREQFIKQIMKQKQYYDICASGIQDD